MDLLKKIISSTNLSACVVVLLVGCQSENKNVTEPIVAQGVAQPVDLPAAGVSDSTISASATSDPTTPESTTPELESESTTNTAQPWAVPSLAGALNISANKTLQKYDAGIQSQFGGTCSAFATAAAINNRLKQKGYKQEVSERHLWSLYGVYDAYYAVEAAKKNYLTLQESWPTYGVRSTDYLDHRSIRVTQSVEHGYNFESALQGLNRGNPLIMAIQVPTDLANCRAEIRSTASYTTGQHVVEAVGYQLDDHVAGGGYFIIKNSWGETCGDHGYHTYPFSLCKRSDLYCYFIEIKDVEVL